MMVAVVEMRRHFLFSIWSRSVAVNWDLPDRKAIFSMIHIGFLDGAAENLEPQSTNRDCSERAEIRIPARWRVGMISPSFYAPPVFIFSSP